ncbi:MAG: S-layer protein [Candidatus Nanohaloarchaea archaeon]|nr:S-layer protein [Candidatus Nanohaloarchaea archaeon]
MKVKNTIKKVGAAAGSALMVGMTMGSAATLSDFPQPFVTDDGQVQSQIVVGSQGKQADVVGAINVAATLGQSAVQTETRTETVSTGGTATFGWSATGGTTLDTTNDQLYFNDRLDTVRDTLTADHLDQLSDVTYQDDAGDETDIEFFMYPGNRSVQFGQPSDRNNQDPVLYVQNPSNPTSTNNLFELQANFENELAFNSSDVEDTEIQLFGDTYTVSTDTTGSELHLLASQETVDIDTGTSQTITVGGGEVTVEAVAASDSNTGSFRVNGQLYEKDEEQTVSVNGEEIRLDEVVQTGGSDSGTGVLQFAVGSGKLVLKDGQAIEDDNGDDIDGTMVNFDADSKGNSNPVDDVSSLEIYVGSNDDDHEYVTPAEDGMYSHPQFEDFTFHFGGLNPDAGQGAGDNVDEVAFNPSGDNDVEVSFTGSGGDSATVSFAHNASGSISLADDNDNPIHVVENSTVAEDEYFVTDAGDFAHLWEVTNVDESSSNDEATADLRDVVTGAQVEVDVDRPSGASGTGATYNGTEVIDGQTYQFVVDTSNNDVTAGWGSNAAIHGQNIVDAGDRITVFPSLDLKSGAGLSFTENATVTGTGGNDVTLEVPSTESTDAQTLSVVSGTNGYGNDSISPSGAANTSYQVYNASQAGTPVTNFTIAPDYGSDPAEAGPGVMVVQPEDDNDLENSYMVELDNPGDWDFSNDQIQAQSIDGYTGTTRSTTSLESDSDVTAGYDVFGAHTLEDSDDQGSVTIHTPSGQATAGAAFTGPDGDLTAGGGGGSGTVTYTALAGTPSLPDMAMLDTEVTSSVRQNSHLILVGGPAVNQLVSDLAQDNSDVWTASQWRSQSSSGNARLNLVNDAFASGQDALIVAGFSASDTRGAARYLANYEANQANLQGTNAVSLSSADYPTAQ